MYNKVRCLICGTIHMDNTSDNNYTLYSYCIKCKDEQVSQKV